MAKRFIDTAMWTQNQWFRRLKPNSKLFWFYLISTCDNVGVWEEDWDLASFIIGTQLNRDEIIEDLDGKIRKLSNNKIWLRDFCNFQYKELNERTADKPRQSYIALLKSHGLWEEYANPMDGVWEDFYASKEKDKE